MEHKDILRSVSLTIWQLVQFAMLIANGRQEFSNPTHIYEVTEAWNMSMLIDLLLIANRSWFKQKENAQSRIECLWAEVNRVSSAY